MGRVGLGCWGFPSVLVYTCRPGDFPIFGFSYFPLYFPNVWWRPVWRKVYPSGLGWIRLAVWVIVAGWVVSAYWAGIIMGWINRTLSTRMIQLILDNPQGQPNLPV